MKLALIGATGLVGQAVRHVLAERSLGISTLLPVASASAATRTITFAGAPHDLLSMEAAFAARPELAIFAAGITAAKTWAPRFVAQGAVVIDNSTAWRMDPACKLIVPEVNGHLLQAGDRLIANPNCSTIQLVMALAPLHQRYGLRRVVVSTYQAVTGSGRAGVEQLVQERKGASVTSSAYPHPIDCNVIPHIDDFLDNGYTKEEIKLVQETQKILAAPSLRVTATAVRVPVLGGHSLAVNVELMQDFELEEVCQLLQAMPGVVVQDDVAQHQYPMPYQVQHQDAVFVGRMRRDMSQACSLNLWVVADNLRKGAATNAVQIAEHMRGFV